VDRVTKQGDALLVKLQPLIVKRDTCVAEHKTNRVERVQPDGRVMYELQCDQTAIVAKDEQWPPFKVAARYETNPEFRLIAVGGPTSVSTEMSLPDRTSGDTALPASANGSDIAEWQSLGYTPSRYASAWKEAFSNYHQIFPHQFLGLALYPGLPIGENGQADPSQKVATELNGNRDRPLSKRDPNDETKPIIPAGRQ